MSRFWPDNPLFDPTSDPFARVEYIMQGRKGGKAENLRVYDTKERLLIDKELTDRAIDFRQRQQRASGRGAHRQCRHPVAGRPREQL